MQFILFPLDPFDRLRPTLNKYFLKQFYWAFYALGEQDWTKFLIQINFEISLR